MNVIRMVRKENAKALLIERFNKPDGDADAVFKKYRSHIEFEVIELVDSFFQDGSSSMSKEIFTFIAVADGTFQTISLDSISSRSFLYDVTVAN